MDNDGVNSAAPGANITQPDPNNKYIAVWNDEDRICYYRCYALPSGMGWHNFVMFRRNWMFKRDFVKPGFAIAISFEFRRVTDDDGVPLMFYGSKLTAFPSELWFSVLSGYLFSGGKY